MKFGGIDECHDVDSSSQGLGSSLLGRRARRQPREQHQRVVGKDGAAFFAVQLRAPQVRFA
jgi:hypothetical protein